MSEVKLDCGLTISHYGIVKSLRKPCPCCGDVECFYDCEASQNIQLENTDEVFKRQQRNTFLTGVESLILNHHINGVDITSDSYQNAIYSCLKETV